MKTSLSHQANANVSQSSLLASSRNRLLDQAECEDVPTAVMAMIAAEVFVAVEVVLASPTLV